MKHIEIFRAGKRHDANGQLVEITTQQLANTVAHYNPKFHEAPLVIGHPKSNHPAFGWVKALKLEGDILKAEIDQVDPTFAEMVREGKFKKVSASFYLPDSPANPHQGVLSLRHVGFLGAMPPAVKGLSQVEFADDEIGIVLFNDENECINQQGERSMTEAEIAALKAENETLKAQNMAFEQKALEADLNAVKQSNADFAEELVQAGKLAPVAQAPLLQALNSLAEIKAGREPEFSEGEDILTQFKQALSHLPQVLEFNEVANKDKVATAQEDTVAYAEGTDPQSIEVDKAVRAYMKDKGVDYLTAFNALYH